MAILGGVFGFLVGFVAKGIPGGIGGLVVGLLVFGFQTDNMRRIIAFAVRLGIAGFVIGIGVDQFMETARTEFQEGWFFINLLIACFVIPVVAVFFGMKIQHTSPDRDNPFPGVESIPYPTMCLAGFISIFFGLVLVAFAGDTNAGWVWLGFYVVYVVTDLVVIAVTNKHADLNLY